MVRAQVLAFAVTSMLVVACGTSSRDPGTLGGGNGDPDAGGAGTAALTISPAGQRVLAGTGAVILHATLVGDPGPITWALSGPGTLGATSGPETTYTPPATIDTETVATVTASAHAGLSAEVQITVAPATTIDVTGRVVGPTGVALSGLTVGIGTKTAITAADGRFSISGVVPPYDLNVVLAGTSVAAGRYQGLTRPDPTIVFLFLFSTGDANTATISGTVSGGDPIGTAGEFTAAIFSTSDVRFDLDAIGVTARNNPFTLPVVWFGAESITAAVHVLQWKSPGPGQPPTEYTGYGIHDGIPLARGASVEQTDVTLTRPLTASIAGTVLAPEGYAVSSKALAIELAGLTAVPVGHADTSATDFTFAVPQGIPATASVTAEAQLLGAGTTLARISGIAPGQAGLSIALPSPSLPSSPEDGAGGVTAATTFSWTPLEHGVHVVVFNGEGNVPAVYIVTSATSVPLPDFPSGSTCHWFVATFGPLDSVDAFAGRASLFPALGDSFQTVSETRTFVMR
jgi:hypothetical protein